MKILHLEAGRHFYGGARQVGYLISALARRGVANLLVCPSDNALAENADASVFDSPAGGDLNPLLCHRLARLARRHRPDLIHVHSRRGADTFGGRAARAAGVAAILTRRVESAEPGGWLRFKCRPYRSIVAISTAVRDELERQGIAAARVRLIPSAVDTTLFCPDSAARARLLERYELPQDAVLVGSAGQLIPRKGHGFLLRCLPHPEASALCLLLFGRGPREPELRRRARELGLGARVVFCGYEPDWPALLPGLDLFLHPARREGLGTVVLEAMSAGVPVIASRVGGIVDVIENGVDGRLVAPNDVTAWRDAVLELLADPAKRRRLAAAGRRKVESRFTIDRMTDSYVELYREIVGNGGG